MRSICSRCNSPVVYKTVESKSLPRRNRVGKFTTMPAHCSNPDCVYFDETRTVLGWAKSADDPDPQGS